MAMTDISIDLETLGNTFDAAILSVGACQFNRHTGEIGVTYVAHIKLDDALQSGHVNGDTLAWWMLQPDQARDQFAFTQRVSMFHALSGLSKFVAETNPGVDVPVWGNGPIFDISALENAYRRALSGKPAWNFWNVRDMRTLLDVAWQVALFDKKTVPFAGTPHNALDDAVHQAKVMARAFDAINKSTGHRTLTNYN